MHAKPDLRVFLKWVIAVSGSVLTDVIWLKQMAKLSLALVLLLCTFLGCNAKNEVQPIANSDAENTASVSAAPATKKLSERDGQLIRFLLNDSDNDPGDRIYFLTTTPMNKWTNDGGWSSLPDSFHSSISNLQTKYRTADEAYLSGGHVLVRGSDETAWMKWVTIVEWKSDTVVTVEEGVWCCPLGGGASTVTYEKIDGEWQIKDIGSSWVS